MIYITGDTHRDFYRLNSIDENNMVIILGDVGINYYLNDKDKKIKQKLNDMNIKLFCIQGNHEERPENIKTYKEVDMLDGKVFIEDEYPNLIFAKNGEVYNINGKSVLVIGGAYSIDKEYRIINGHKWFENEQLSELEKTEILNKYSGKHIDIVLTHTCPKKYEPIEVFMSGFDQSKIDKSMEIFLDKVEENIDYDKWYCGHFHTEKKIEKLEFMFGRIKLFGSNEFYPKYDEFGYEILRDAYSQKEIIKNEFKCPMCNSNDIVLIKGDGFYIDGLDIIGISCKNCIKTYGFNDVKYKNGYPREL